jgi:hypothetical protein
MQTKSSGCLIPETKQDREELLMNLDDRGVRHSVGFSRDGVKGTLDFSGDTVAWQPNGSLRVSLKENGIQRPIYFWVFETGGQPPRSPWFSLTPKESDATPWED